MQRKDIPPEPTIATCSDFGAFYFGLPKGDWTSPQNPNLWHDGTKTLFDPCPAGWRVPRGGEDKLSPWQAFTADNGPWETNGPATGRLWSGIVFPGTAWYPANGYRAVEYGHLGAVGIAGYAWCSTAEKEEAFRLYFPETLVAPDTPHPRSRAVPVRCVRE